MDVKNRWVAYCAGNTRDATEDNWNNFVLKIFLNWRQRQLELDPNAPKINANAQTEYADLHYSFARFTEGADTYQELVALESKRHSV
jgi:hypothetical protein